MNPQVSIVVPIYNVECYIDQCINSLINQTYKNIEIILVNDGSPDNSPFIADRYAEKDPRIHVIHKKNGGLSDARNVGLSLSRGKYICFVDSDDYVELEMIEKTVSQMLVSQVDVLIYGLYNEIHDEVGNIINKNTVSINPDDPYSVMSVIGYAWNKLYNTDFLKKNKLQFEKGLALVEDIVFNEKVFSVSNRIEYLDVPLYHYVSRKRLTLVKKYHADSYALYKKGFYARRKLMSILFEKNYELNNLIAKSQLDGIRYCCSNMFHYTNDLTFIEKYNNIKEMLEDSETIKQMSYVKTDNLYDKFILFIIKNKLSFCLLILYSLSSIVKKKEVIA